MSGGPVPYGQKYTAASRGIWNKIRGWLAMVPNRSSGNALVGYFRNPAPYNLPTSADDHTVGQKPAADIAENPYWKRDYRRNYPKTSVFNQSAIAGLLSYGSVAQPRIAKGAEGAKQLATVANNEVSLNTVLANKEVLKEVFESSGMPPLPPAMKKKTYHIVTDVEQHGQYPSDYPVRIFN